jgi:hypothetical protein
MTNFSLFLGKFFQLFLYHIIGKRKRKKNPIGDPTPLVTRMFPKILLVGTCPTLTDDKISTKSLLGCSSIDEMKKLKIKN